MSADRRASSSTGKDSGEGLPAANEMVSLSAGALRISRMALGFMPDMESEKRYCMVLPFLVKKTIILYYITPFYKMQ